jgi:hypothetical protein
VFSFFVVNFFIYFFLLISLSFLVACSLSFHLSLSADSALSLSFQARVIAPLLVLEVGHVQKMKKLYGLNFHNGRVWEPLRLCSLCMDDWECDIGTDAEIYREAELLHADNEQLADEVLGTTRGNEDDDDDNVSVELNRADVPTTPMGGIDIDKIVHEGEHETRPEELPPLQNLHEKHENLKHHKRRSRVLRMQMGQSTHDIHSLDLGDL